MLLKQLADSAESFTASFIYSSQSFVRECVCAQKPLQVARHWFSQINYSRDTSSALPRLKGSAQVCKS